MGLLVFMVVSAIIYEIKIAKDHDKWCKLAMHDYPDMIKTVAIFDNYVEFAKMLNKPEDKIFEEAYYLIYEEWYYLNYK